MRLRLFPATAVLLAVVASLSVLAVNGRPLFYFDTGSYLAQGNEILSRLGLGATGGARPEADGTGNTGGDGAGDGAAKGTGGDKTVIASRSAAYGLILALVLRLSGPLGLVAMNLAVIGLPTLLLARLLAPEVRQRAAGSGLAAPLPLAAALLCLGALGSLPFYVAYLLPDIYAPALILILALVAAYRRGIGWAWLAVMGVIAALAVLSHPGHLLMAALMAPAVVIVSLGARGALRVRGAWVAGGLVVALIAGGLAERAALGLVVDRVMGKRLLYMPFLTARLIDDGPGLALLQDRCPDPAFPTCALYSALLLSDDPARLDAPNILFARDGRVGSFALLPAPEKEAVARAQTGFVLDVVAARPGEVAGAILRNTVAQLTAIRVDMTIPTETMGGMAAALSPAFPTALDDGRLVHRGRGWLDGLATLHATLYAASALVVALGLARRGMPAGFRPFLAICVTGILANAIVFGAVSEPADRYGARVAFLLPMLAGLVLTLWRRPAGGAVSPR